MVRCHKEKIDWEKLFTCNRTENCKYTKNANKSTQKETTEKKNRRKMSRQSTEVLQISFKH